MTSDVISAHEHCKANRAELLSGRECGCFYCCRTFPPAEIVSWTDDRDGGPQTAVCPKCGIDSVIGSESGYPITHDFLQSMHQHWFASHIPDAEVVLPSDQTSLFQDRSFWGMTATQFLGAFNDNLFKQLVLLLAVGGAAGALVAAGAEGEHAPDRQPLAMLVFSAPFLLFSGFAGYLSERLSKRSNQHQNPAFPTNRLILRC